MHSSRGHVLGLALLLLAGEAMSSDRVEEIVLAELSPKASSTELVSRLLTPIVQDRMQRYLEANPTRLVDQSIVPGAETFEVRLPRDAGKSRPGVLVFVWPADEIGPPSEWWPVLDRHNLVYVAARASGNKENVFDRRVPLALHGYDLVSRARAIDSDRIFIAGFSGGSRVAQRVALAYPDIFRGVVLMAGSDPIGTAGFTPPARGLMRLFQQRTRLVYATGDRDLPNRAKDERTRRSLAGLCVAGVSRVFFPKLDHWIPDGRGLDKVLQALAAPVSPAVEDAQCLQALSSKIDEALIQVEHHIAKREFPQAADRLVELDDLYGGLAAPRSVDIARRLEEAIMSQSE